MIDIRRVEKAFGAQRVLQAVDLAIAPARVTAIVGPNGAGKTTLIKMIVGLVRPDAGEIRFDGVPIGDGHAHRARIGYMPQIARFPDNLTGAELLAMLTDLRGGEGACAARHDEMLIGALGIEQELAKPLRVLSGGTRQKVNAVIAFLFHPELLILDEPTAGLDPVASSTLKDVILAARGAGRTVLLTSHNMSELEELADDVAFLLDGRVRYHGPVHDLKRRTRQSNLERAIAEVMMRGVAA